MAAAEPRAERRPWPLGARAGLAILLLLAVLGLLAPILSPADPAEQLDSFGGRWRPPLTTLLELRLKNGSTLLADRAELQGDEYLLVRHDKTEKVPASSVLRAPAPRTYLLGTDHLGRDVLSRWLYATRVSLAVGAFALLVACSLGITIGALAALGPAWLDTALMRLVDAFLALPWIFLMITVAAFTPSSATTLVLLLAGTTWMATSRLTRAQIKTVSQRDYVLAARGLGISPLRIFLRHILPNISTPLLVDATQKAGVYILSEASLSFLGLGIQPPLASWGNMIQDGRNFLLSGWWLILAPTLSLLATGLAVQWLADSLRDVFDPRNRQL